MLEQKVRIISEGLARTMDRRKFMKSMGTTLFVGMAALASGHGKALAASDKDGSPVNNPPQCAPPGPYCNLNGVNEPNGCNGGSCFQHLQNGEVAQCRVYYIYQAGCWTTYVTGGYWVCCDCECNFSFGRRTCGCAQFSTNPKPRPDGPGAGAFD